MNILLVSLQFEQTATGGGGVHVKAIQEHFVKLGHIVTILSIHTNRTIENIDLLDDWKIPYSIEKRENLEIIRFKLDDNIDHPYVGDKDIELNRIKRFADIAIDWIKEHSSNIDVIHLHGHHIIPGYMAKQLQGIKKTVSTLHALETTYMVGKGEFIGAFHGTKYVLQKIREWESMARFADFIIVNSNMVEQEFKTIIKEFDSDIEKYEDKIKLIASGCNDDFLMTEKEILNKTKQKPDIVNLVTFCRIDPSKGVEYSILGAIEGAKIAKNYKFCLTIAGIPASYEYKKKIEEQIKNIPSNLEIKFKFLNAISSIDEKKEILDDKNIYIFPTLKEPFGMSIIEASARANIIISADTNGPRYMFEDGIGEKKEWGLITKYGSLVDITQDPVKFFPKNIGESIVWVLDNWEQNITYIFNFNKKIKDNWTWLGITNKYIELFNK